MSLNVLIVDDEGLARERLCQLLTTCPGYQVIGQAASGASAIAKYDQLKPDIVLLDIRMPEMDGIETAQHLSTLDTPPAIIFCTAFDDYALAAFNVHAIDYVLKPVRKERLISALNKASELNKATLATLCQLTPDSTPLQQNLCIPGHHGVSIIPIKDVIYFMADQKYITVRTQQAKPLMEASLKALEQTYAGQFIRVHRNALAAIDAIKGMEKQASGQWQLHFKVIEDTLEISRRQVTTVRQCIEHYNTRL